MRHRMIDFHTGLGNPSKELLDNSGKVSKKILKEATELFFKKYGGCDYKVTKEGILIGIEPAYQYEKLKRNKHRK